ncbi:zinc finger MYM-type protein 1-like [Solanum tuberosum]|uniref:zinc finger MYM-type protein 1-like n=1 Tax=Solanum tuberosum TaxID=4113 RepID=UPI00073A13A6|nr:PREDICTED: zinc finger MYM-type protein 1-like [Solanum tuberosum]
MDKFLIQLPKPKDGQPSSSSNQPFVSSQVAPEVQRHINSYPLSNTDNMLDFKSLEADPKDQMPISSYGPNIRDANELESRGNVGDSFTRADFRCWNKALERFKKHVGKMRLNASIDVARFLLTSGFPFRGHDESEGSKYKGAFLELLKWYGDRSFDVGRVILGNAPQNDMMICPTIQKDIVEACAKETTKAIIEDLDGDYFGILVDESKDVSHKEQMALILRYVNKSGMVIERFLGIVHVNDTSSQSLKKAIYSLFLDHSLCTSKIRGQGYDGASNMQGEINGLKSLILQDTSSAYYIHCFAHQLQLALAGLSKKNSDVDNFFYVLTNILNTIGASFKRRDSLRQHHEEDKLEELLKFGKVHTRQGLNQERGLQRPGDTLWGSHFKTLDNFLILFSSISNVLKDMKRDCPYHLDRFAAKNLLSKIHEFEFVFMLRLMFKVLLLTNELNKVLQKKDQDIVNAMGLLDLSKKRLQMMIEDEWDSMMDEVSLFCGKHGISIPKMNEGYSNGKSKRKRSNISYLSHFRVKVFYVVIDLALQELNNRFDVVTSDLLLGMTSLSPVDSFANFHKDRIMKLAEYYPSEFDDKEIRELNFQLNDFIVYAQKCDRKFLNLKGIKDLARVMIETKLIKLGHLCIYL